MAAGSPTSGGEDGAGGAVVGGVGEGGGEAEAGGGGLVGAQLHQAGPEAERVEVLAEEGAQVLEEVLAHEAADAGSRWRGGRS